MNYKIEIPSLKLDFTLPPSKSVVHRNLIVQFLRAIKTSGGHGLSAVPEALEGPQPNDNDDICATRACLKALYEGSQNDEEIIYMPCNESGSTLRFMISVGAAFLNYMGLAQKKKLVFLPKGRLIERPLEQLVVCLTKRGVDVVVDKSAGTVTVSGILTPGCFEIEGNVSSQYISGLLMAQIVLPGFSVELKGELESKGYVDLTKRVVEENGIPNEGDWSSAAFLLCLGALTPNSQVILHGLSKSSAQKDKIILEILEQLGVHSSWNNDTVSLKSERSEAPSTLELDATDYPDIVPYIAIVAAAFSKETKIKNISRLHFKECDRVEAIIQTLAAVGVCAVEKDGTLIIQNQNCQNKKPEEAIEIKTFGDHRIAMTAALVAAWTGCPVLIDNKECVNKSFPGLWEIIENARI
ncbi:MAG: hypothetical protein J5687_09245 [Treponema sp.]|nr:hypothetical protein [Treponema sp.]